MSNVLHSDRKTERTVNTLRTKSIFASLPDAVKAELANGARRLKFADGTIVQHRGDVSSNFFSIAKGQIKVGRYDEHGEMQAIFILGEGDSFGEMGCLGSFPQIADAEAVGDAELIEISEKKFIAALLASPALSRHVMQVLSLQLQEAMENLLIYQKMPTHLRLARALLLMCDDRGAPVDLLIRHQELAELMGVSRMSIAKTLEQLEQLKFIRRGYRQITVTDTDAMKQWMLIQMAL